MAVIGYCMKCKEKREMKDTEEVTMKNGRKAIKGKCSTCGTGMYKIQGKQNHSFNKNCRAKQRRGLFLSRDDELVSNTYWFIVCIQYTATAPALTGNRASLWIYIASMSIMKKQSVAGSVNQVTMFDKNDGQHSEISNTPFRAYWLRNLISS